MANWLTHLRVAQSVKKHFDFKVDLEKYYIGCIATDCGKICINKEGKKFYDPPRYTSHWTDDIKDWDRNIYYERFYYKYLKDESNELKKSFYWGYYVHLLTDALWIEIVYRPLIDEFKSIDEFKIKALKQVRDDSYNVELKFLNSNHDFNPLKILKSIKEFENIYLDYASSEVVLEKVNWILDMYKTSNIEEKLDFTYFTYEIWDC